VSNSGKLERHRRVSQAGIRLLLLDNVPTGLLPGSDYVALVSADNFGLGAIAASLLADRLAPETTVGIIAYTSEFFVTNEREIAFDAAGQEALALVAAQPDLAGIFVVWDTPAMEVVKALDDAGQHVPVTTIDLGRDAALDLVAGGMICGIGAQQPHLQGTAVAQARILALLGKPTPA
jgi:ribose transport system substrate-binding protein